MVEALYFTLLSYIPLPYGFESIQGQNIYMEKKIRRYVYGWLSPFGRGGFTGISRECRDMSEMCPGFPPTQAALRIILSNEGDEV